MVDVLTETRTDRPIDKVSSYAADPDNAPKWCEKINRAAPLMAFAMKKANRKDLARMKALLEEEKA